MIPAAPLILFDDARDGAREGGAPARLYRDPVRVLEAWEPDAVRRLLAEVRAGVAAGRHAAGFLSYEAGVAFEPSAGATNGATNGTATPLAWFALFEGYETIADVAAWLPDAAGAWAGSPVPRVSRDEYDAMLARVLALIAAGDIYQANLTFRADVRFAGSPLALYARLRAASAAGWSAYADTGSDRLLSLSPELFFRLDRGAIVCRPMKGTARRQEEARADASAADALAADEKQRAENLMIVDLMRNDLSRIAAPGSVAVPELFAVERYPTVHQMTSTVTATLGEGRDAIDVLAALFPCGSITGAPKVRAMLVIGEVETTPRGAYTGAIGWIDPNGDAQFNVAIRTLTIHAAEETATLGLGGGIVADSVADAEWAEALAKGGFVTHGQRGFDLIETMAFDPEEGIALLERHLERMRASAETFGWRFDRHAVRNELQAATFRLRGAARLRLLLGNSGAIAIETAPAPPARIAPMLVALAPLPVDARDFRLRHKTSDRAFYDRARRLGGADETVFVDPAGFVTEGSFTSVFVERGGTLVTPPVGRGLLPGVLRADLIANGRAVEGDLTVADLADGFLLGNALRGLMPAVVAVAKSSAAPL